MNPEDTTAWASVPWAPVTDESQTNTIIGWHKHLVPYIPGACHLQTLDVWVPASSLTTPSSSSDLPLRPSSSSKPWLVFIHGGAWRDPKVDNAAAAPTAHFLLQRAAAASASTSTTPLPLAGIASLNYRLSPHPRYPADPVARAARHPDHIADVRTGLAFLQRVVGLGDGKWVLSGHSCGATLSFQAVVNPARWGLGLGLEKGSSGAGRFAPDVLVGLDGLYDLDGFVACPPASHAPLRDGYAEFTTGAFGDDRTVWRAACPTTAEGDWVGEWVAGGERKKKKRVVLVQSREDGLVPYEQLEGMRARLQKSETALEVQEFEAGGDHDDLWRKGDRMAEILAEVLSAL